MATFRIIKNNLNAYCDMQIAAFRHIRSVKIEKNDGSFPGFFWATELEWDTNNPEGLEKLLTGNDAIISFERVS